MIANVIVAARMRMVELAGLDVWLAIATLYVCVCSSQKSRLTVMSLLLRI